MTCGVVPADRESPGAAGVVQLEAVVTPSARATATASTERGAAAAAGVRPQNPWYTVSASGIRTMIVAAAPAAAARKLGG